MNAQEEENTQAEQSGGALSAQTNSGACGLVVYTTRARCRVWLASLLFQPQGQQQHASLCRRRQRAASSTAKASRPAPPARGWG